MKEKITAPTQMCGVYFFDVYNSCLKTYKSCLKAYKSCLKLILNFKWNVIDINTMFCPIKVNSTVHTSSYYVLDLLCVTYWIWGLNWTWGWQIDLYDPQIIYMLMLHRHLVNFATHKL